MEIRVDTALKIREGYEINFCFQEDGTISLSKKCGVDVAFQYIVGINEGTEITLLVICLIWYPQDAKLDVWNRLNL